MTIDQVVDTKPVLEVRDLSVRFRSRTGSVQALDQVSVRLNRSEILGVVGESGCGKTTLGMAVMGLLPDAAVVESGAVRVGEHELLDLSPRQLRSVRGRDLGMVFQDSLTSLNPVMPVARQIGEVLRYKAQMSKRAAHSRAVELLDLVGIPDPAIRARDYPHQLSGGMRQRVVIAMAIACEPKVLIADEPTTALDVTVQQQVLELLGDLRREVGIAIMLITHNLGVVSRMAERIIVMYAGRAVEEGPTRGVLREPRHPYTKRLIAATPRELDLTDRHDRRLQEIPGLVPVLRGPAAHCSFAPRCQRAVDLCTSRRPELETTTHGGTVACFRPEDAP
jgi:peptide/nickel transport system ATP-binding protein